MRLDGWPLPLASVPHFLWTYFRAEVTPASTPYLSASKLTLGAIRTEIERLAAGRKVIGLSWKSKNPRFQAEKSQSLSKLMNFFDSERYYLVSLQYGDVLDDFRGCSERQRKFLYLNENINFFDDIEALCDVISICDAVVSTSNTTAHISGAMGMKTVVLVSNGMSRFWYWHRGAARSPWYNNTSIVELSSMGPSFRFGQLG
jgi:ADP-heptose:LPS heptosyltransferase